MIIDEPLTQEEKKLISDFVVGNSDHHEPGSVYDQVTLQALKTNHAIIIDIRKAIETWSVPMETIGLLFDKPQPFLAELNLCVENLLIGLNTSLSVDSKGFASVHLKNICLKTDKNNYLKVNQLYNPDYFNSLVQVDGVVKSMSINESRAITATFRCRECGNEDIIPQTTFLLTKPMFCSSCLNKTFKHMKTKRIPLTIMEIEELPDNDDELNSTITIFVEGNAHKLLAENQVKIGTRVKITGFVSTTPAYAQPILDNSKSIQKAVLLGNYVELLEEEVVNMTITQDDEAKIKELSQNPDIFTLLTNSIAPQLEGLTNVKEAVLYSLFGGVRRTGKVNTRGIINILIVSDPSIGKTTMFDNIRKIAPKSKKILGGTTTKSGIGAGATRSEITGKFTIEAGALVMANKGILIIDELDKMTPEDMASLHESMESCSVTKTIVGQNRTFNAETTIISGCNPKSGRFDDYDPITKQINLPPAILSRFDSIFAMRDKPNSDQDKSIISKIYRNYSQPDLISSPVPPEILRKYIIYAKRIAPKFTHNQEVQEFLSEFYVSMRNTSTTQNGQTTIPITTRQAESILRFAEASARIRLSEQVEREDIQRGINIIIKYLKEFGFDQTTGKFDIDRVVSDTSSSSRTIAKVILDTLTNHDVLSYELLATKVKEVLPGVKDYDIEETISKLSRKGDVTEPKRGYYQAI